MLPPGIFVTNFKGVFKIKAGRAGIPGMILATLTPRVYSCRSWNIVVGLRTPILLNAYRCAPAK